MSHLPLPSSTVNANADNSENWSWPKAIGAIFVSLLALVGVLVVGYVVAAYALFDTVRTDVYGFFRQTAGLDQPTALTLAFGIGLIVFVVLRGSFWGLMIGRVSRALMLLAGIGLLGYWAVSTFATAPMTPGNKPNQKYAVVSGQCVFFDIESAVDPRTGKKLYPVTEKVLEACANRKNGKAPKEVDVSNPAKVEWFDRVLGYPAVYYVTRFNGQMAFFDAPGTDPVTGRPLEPVTAQVVQTVMSRSLGESSASASLASVATSPAVQSLPIAAPDVRHESRVGLSEASGTTANSAAPALTRDAVLLVGDAANYAQTLIERLHREGVMRHAQRLPGTVAWPANGAPDQAALEAARMAGIRSVAVVSLQKDVRTTAELAGFTHASLSVNTRVFDTQTGRTIRSTQSHAEGRAFDTASAIAQAIGQLGS